jgi:hypothetical protein
VREANDDIVGMPHNHHSARGLVPSPALSPQIEHIVQVDVGEQWRNHRPLPRPLFTDRDDPVFQHARLEPFLDQADDAWIANPMLDETDQPTLADFIEKGSDVRVKNEVHLLVGDPDRQSVQRIVLAALRPEAIAARNAALTASSLAPG